MVNLLNFILEDLLKDKELIKQFKKSFEEDSNFLHIGIGRYIRNKYLWNNKNNTEALAQYYNVDNVDDISSCIIKDLFDKLKK